MKLEFFRQFSEKSSSIKFMKICPVGAKLSQVDGQTYRHT